MGKPKKEISIAQWARIGRYARSGCQNGTIAALMEWDQQFIEGRKDILRFLLLKRGQRKLFKRNEQDKHAKTQVVMSIFQGKNELGQADKQEITGKDGSLLIPMTLIVQPQGMIDAPGSPVSRLTGDVGDNAVDSGDVKE